MLSQLRPPFLKPICLPGIFDAGQYQVLTLLFIAMRGVHCRCLKPLGVRDK